MGRLLTVRFQGPQGVESGRRASIGAPRTISGTWDSTMAGYKDLDFNERRAASQKARENALAQLKARPPVDPAEQARRSAEREARDAARDEKRRAAKEARLQAAEAARSDQARAEGEVAAPSPGPAQLTDEERKAARDAKYAARKKKKSKR